MTALTKLRKDLGLGSLKQFYNLDQYERAVLGLDVNGGVENWKSAFTEKISGLTDEADRVLARVAWNIPLLPGETEDDSLRRHEWNSLNWTKRAEWAGGSDVLPWRNEGDVRIEASRIAYLLALTYENHLPDLERQTTTDIDLVERQSAVLPEIPTELLKYKTHGQLHRIRCASVQAPVEDRLTRFKWDDMGVGIEILRDQISNFGTHIEPDVVVGINEAGLVMATFLTSVVFHRAPAVGYVRFRGSGPNKVVDVRNSALPIDRLKSSSTVMLCDFEVKTTNVLTWTLDYLAKLGMQPDADKYAAIMGAATNLAAGEFVGIERTEWDLESLPCGPPIGRAGLAGLFVACLMPFPGIEPPLDLR